MDESPDLPRDELIAMARENIRHAKADSIPQEDAVLRVPASHYFDEDRWRLEMDRVFRRMPLMLALASEVAGPGDYKSMTVADVPLLIVRGADGEVRAFVNSCAHRGAVVVPEGQGNERRFVCPYHAWAYDHEGALVGIRARDDFGKIDRSCHALVPLPAAERAGLVWVTVDPDAQQEERGDALDIDLFLSGYDRVLAHFGFASWQVVSRREVAGPNWKIAYDGYLDLYHLPVLHKNTFGPKMPDRAIYTSWGPHQRVTSPNPMLIRLEDVPEEEWSTRELLQGVWTIFPHVSIATFDAGGEGALFSQLFPGKTPGESVTVQSYAMKEEPDEEGRKAADEMVDLLEYVVREEDYATGLRQQQALRTGAQREVLFGRNEGGGHRFHGWLDRLLALEDSELPDHFRASAR